MTSPLSSQERMFDICLSKLETTILTPSGDVLVCRSRDFFRIPEVMIVSRPQQSSKNGFCSVDTESLCDVCANGVHQSHTEPNGTKQKQLAGNPNMNAHTNSNTHTHTHTQSDNESAKENYNDLAAPPSFDYSNFEPVPPVGYKPPRLPLAQVPEHNADSQDSLAKLFGSLLASPIHESEQHRTAMTPLTPTTPTVLHGVTTCLLREIRISTISANALGSHVLLISTHALLFSYGANNHGQLGLGTTEPFVPTPTLVTAVLEGGGKTVLCAAGEDYSLICVKTRRKDNPTDSNVANLHQLYGFGSNTGNKLGLYKNTSETSTTLPHRVSLHARTTATLDAYIADPSLPEPVASRDGVICLAASSNHSAALVRSAAGAVDLFMWGEPGATGLASESGAMTKVESLSYNPALAHDEDSYLEPSEYPTQIALGINCTFVLLNTGRCLSFGGSHLLPEKVCLEPTEVKLGARIVSLSVGQRHVLARCVNNKVYTWGIDPATQITQPTPLELPHGAIQAVAGYDASAFVQNNGTVRTCGAKSGRLGQGEVPPNPKIPTPLFGGLRLWR